jgi:hypothetical protein
MELHIKLVLRIAKYTKFNNRAIKKAPMIFGA